MKKDDQSNGKKDALTVCPQCKANLLRVDVKKHILTCSKYVPTYLHNIRRFKDQLTPSYAQFLIAEMDLIKEELEAGLVKSNGSPANKSVVKSEPKDIKSIQKEAKVEPTAIKTFIKEEPIKKEPMIAQKQTKKAKAAMEGTIQLQDLFDYKEIPIVQQTIECADPTCTKPASIHDIQNFAYLDQCLHTICKYCFKNYVRNNYLKTNGELLCPNKKCKQPILRLQIQQILQPLVLSKLQNELNSKLISALVTCQKCEQQYHFEKGKPSDAPKSTPEGKSLIPAMAKHYAENRFQCAKCKSDQCKTCKIIPYHIGFNCQDYAEHKLKKKCRYCRQVLPKGYISETGIRTFDDICQSENCQVQMKEACSKKLTCGHSCCGFIQEKSCPPCLKETCAKSNSQALMGQDENSYCSLCYVEALVEAPCVKSKCGHIFHLKCLKKRLALKWSTPRINFRFCQCPLCNAWIELPAQCQLAKSLENFKKLQKTIEEKAIKRLSHQGLEKDKKITESKSEYYNKPSKYAQAIYAYFQCYECHQPYFGGRKNCADAMNEGSEDKKFNPKELICPSCCPVQANDCKKHGKEFISFKCKFCCSVAQWFCWGNTHFCDNCHKKQIGGEYISRKSKEELAKCEGKGKCPVGGQHGGNGEEFCLGCGICRGDRMDAKDF